MVQRWASGTGCRGGVESSECYPMLKFVELQVRVWSITHVLLVLSGLGLVRKFSAAKIGGSVAPPGVSRVSGAHPGGFREAPLKQN